MPKRLGKRLATGLARVSLVMVGWDRVPRAQVADPSVFSETCGSWTGRPAQEGGSARQCAMEQRSVWRDPDSGRRRPLH